MQTSFYNQERYDRVLKRAKGSENSRVDYPSRVRIALTEHRTNSLTNNAIVLEAKIIHCLVYCFFNLLPITPALDEFVYVLGKGEEPRQDPKVLYILQDGTYRHIWLYP